MFIGLGTIAGMLGGLVKGGVETYFDYKKNQQEIQFKQNDVEAQRQHELLIFDKQLDLAKANLDIETQKRIFGESQAKTDVIKSNNENENKFYELVQNTLSYTKPLAYIKREDNVIMWDWLAGLCNVKICVTNCFKTAPQMFIITLTGMPLAFVMIFKLKLLSQTLQIENGYLTATTVLGYFVLCYLDVWVGLAGFFIGQKKTLDILKKKS